LVDIYTLEIFGPTKGKGWQYRIIKARERGSSLEGTILLTSFSTIDHLTEPDILMCLKEGLNHIEENFGHIISVVQNIESAGFSELSKNESVAIKLFVVVRERPSPRPTKSRR